MLFFISRLDKPASLLNSQQIFKEVASEKFRVADGAYKSREIDEQVASCTTCETNIQAWIDGEMERSIQKMSKLSSFL